MNALAVAVKEARLAQGRTQQQVADRGGLGPTLMNRLETGRAKYLTWADLQGLAIGLGVELRLLLNCIPQSNRGKRYMALD